MAGGGGRRRREAAAVITVAEEGGRWYRLSFLTWRKEYKENTIYIKSFKSEETPRTYSTRQSHGGSSGQRPSCRRQLRRSHPFENNRDLHCHPPSHNRQQRQLSGNNSYVAPLTYVAFLLLPSTCLTPDSILSALCLVRTPTGHEEGSTSDGGFVSPSQFRSRSSEARRNGGGGSRLGCIW